MRTDRFSLEQHAMFERIATVMAIIGVLVGAASAAWGYVNPPVTISMICALALLGADSIRTDDDGLSVALRWFGIFCAGVIGYFCQSATVMMTCLGALFGLAMAGHGSQPQRAVGVLAGVLGTWWAVAVTTSVAPLVRSVPHELVDGALGGVIVGVAMVANHIRVHADAMSARLWNLGGDTGTRLQKTWTRCRASLRGAEPKARRELLTLLEVNAGEAERLSVQLQTLDLRLVAADRKDAEVQLGLLKADVESATDATVRMQLSSAASSLSDSLEALDAMQRKRERLGAELRLKLATLERAALALETAQGEPAELRILALRLSQPSAA